MSGDARGLLTALQQADSFFPSGGTAFSWGIETLIADRAADMRADLLPVLLAQLEERWATFDRGVLVCAFDADGDVRMLASIDAEVEAMLLPAELREGSRRAGASLLDVHQRLGTRGAADYRSAIRSGLALGHLAVVQGTVWRALGLTCLEAQAISAHAFCVSLLGAAVRLGVVGHIQSQRALSAAQEVIAGLLQQPASPLDASYSFAPQLDIASMRHETQAARLFVN
jgi:urease accessory protein